MARPKKQTVDYFPHDATANDGTTLTILQSRFGNDGYAFWFKLLERLCSTNGHYMDCRNPSKWQFLLAKTNVSEEKGNLILNLLSELEAIDSELWSQKIIWSQNLVDNIASVYKNRRCEVPLKPNNYNKNKQHSYVSTDDKPNNDEQTTADNPQSKVKYSKGKNIRNNGKLTYGEFTNVFLKPEEYQNLINKFGESNALNKIENLSQYIASKGDKYRSHYATILNWDRRDESKKPSNDTVRKLPYVN